MEEKKPNIYLRRERELKGWSQQRLAEEVGTNEQAVSRWENGSHKPNRHFQTRLCELFGKTALELGCIEGERITTEESGSVIGTMATHTLFIPNHGLVSAASAVPAASPLLERLSYVLNRPSRIDNRLIEYLEERIHAFWQDRHRAALASCDLMIYVLEHFEKVVSLLEGPLFPETRRRLCAVASGTAQLLGELFFDMSDFHHEIEYKKIAITAAREANDRALEAVAWGRLSFVYTYNNQPHETLHCILQARRLASFHANATVCAWLAAVEAEIQSILCNSKACLSALDDATYIEDAQHISKASYWLYFDRSLQAGYQGVCFQRLAQLQKSKQAL